MKDISRYLFIGQQVKANGNEGTIAEINADSVMVDVEGKGTIECQLSDLELDYSVFEEIKKIDDYIHEHIHIDNLELQKALRYHICVCGHPIFSSFLPDGIQAAYNNWLSDKFKEEMNNSIVNALTIEIDTKLLESVLNK